MMNEILASGVKSGYVFTYQVTARDEHGFPSGYTVHANPVPRGVKGWNRLKKLLEINHCDHETGRGERHFFTDEGWVTRQEWKRPANKNSLLLG